MLSVKPVLVAISGLVLSVAAAYAAEPPVPGSTPPPNPDTSLADHADGKNLTNRSLTAIGEAAGKIGDVISTGAQALGSGMYQVTDQATALIEHAKQGMGVRYRWGGISAQTGFDCSGFVRTVVQQTVGKLLPHHAADQAAATQTISKADLQPGDLVFFNTVRRRAYSHVGIYMGDGQFIHAPARGQRVRVDNLSAAYWEKHFGGARRVLTGETSSVNGMSSTNTAGTQDFGDDTFALNTPPTSTSIASGPTPPAAPVMDIPKPGSGGKSWGSKRLSRHAAAKRHHAPKQVIARHSSKSGKTRTALKKQGNHFRHTAKG